jgi:hypothetical protein
MTDTGTAATSEWPGSPPESVPSNSGGARGWRLAPKDNVGARRSENRGRAWLVLSYVLCPCHLPVTMGLIAAVAGGSAVGAALTANAWRLGAVLAVLYAAAVWRGFRNLRQAQRACDTGECRRPS